MRVSITIGYTHGAKTPRVVTLPDVPFETQKKTLKALGTSKTHPEFSRVELWSSAGGWVSHRNFDQDKQPSISTKTDNSKPKPVTR